MYELTELKTAFSEMLQIEKNDLTIEPDKFMTEIMERGNELFEYWIEKFPDLTIDTMQPIFQYYFADRKEKMQDYTPASLAKATALLAMSMGGKSCYDMCAGSGAISIQVWNIKNDCVFFCEELDERVIPFLIFNMAIRNTNATIIHGDILSGERFSAWELRHNAGAFSTIEKCNIPPFTIDVDFCVSNPPYNMKWDAPMPLSADRRFGKWGVPPANNANFAFVLTALNNAKTSVLILPCIIQSSGGIEKDIRSELIDKNKITAVINNPDNMFEATTIGTCFLMLEQMKTTAKVQFIDMQNEYETEIRLQKGQYGGKSHENRTYKKNIKTYSENNLTRLLNAFSLNQNKKGFSISVTKKEIEDNKYRISPSIYIEFEEEIQSHRPYADIINDLNRVRTRQNGLKLVINQTIAKSIGIDTNLLPMSNDPMGNEELLEKIAGVPLVKSDYITFTKKKGEVVLKNNSTETVPNMLLNFVQVWKLFIMECNTEENNYLVELRDALLPDLMTGKLEI